MKGELLSDSLADLTEQNWVAITPGEFCLQIYCEDDHKPSTNSHAPNVTKIT